MGEAFSHAHAACLATQLPKGARCRVADDPHEEWSDESWALWHIERNIGLLRWEFLRFEGEDQPKPLPYPGQAGDKAMAARKREAGKAIVGAAFGIDGGES